MTDGKKGIKCEITKAMNEAMPMSRDICLICKGSRLLCKRPSCPLLQKVRVQAPLGENLSKDLFGPSPTIFVGWTFYPDVYIGPMASIDPEKAGIADDPSRWYGKGFDEIIEMRSLLVRSKKRSNVRDRGKFIEKSREVAMSIKPIDIETSFNKAPTYNLSFSSTSQPMGPAGVIKDFRIAENPKIPRKVDSYATDPVLAKDALTELYDKGFNIYYLTNVLSSGALGLEQNKKLVPTRWSITAVDDMLSKDHMKKIRGYPQLSDFRVYSNTYLDNHFEILMIPGPWEYEQFEAWAPRTLWTLSFDKPVIQQEHECFGGRTRYAEKEAGGYYAARFGVTEALQRQGRQARVVVFREIYEGYVMPVGVWEVRENVRKALENKPRRHSTLTDALTDIGSRLRIPLKEYLDRSEVLKQRKLSEYI